MNRRQFVALASGTPIGTSLLAGCTGGGDDKVRTYTLRMEERTDDAPEDDVLDFDASGLTRRQLSIAREAATEGSYTEADVAWDSIPGREPITMEFRMLIQTIARHVGAEPTVVEATTMSTPGRLDDARYRTVVEVE